MSRILCCWELGGGFGHLYPLVPFVSAFDQAGIEVGFAAQNLARAEQVIGRFNVKLLQSPIWQTPSRSFPLSLNYAQNLYRNGYWHLPSLKANIKAWVHLFEIFQPDIILADHSPTAILAAKLLEIPRAAIGYGFIVPPCSSLMPSLQPWFSIPQHILFPKEKECLNNINETLTELSFKHLGVLADIFEGAEVFLTTFPELDHYGSRQGTHYWGPVLSTENGAEPSRQERSGETIFMYLNYHYRFLYQILSQIKEIGMPTLAVIRDMPETAAKAWEGENIKISTKPVNLKKATEQSHFFITHGGANTGSFILLSGKPLLILPEHLEQCLWGYRISEQNLGLMVNWFNPKPDFSKKLNDLLTDKKILSAVSAFANRHKTYNSDKTVQEICNRLEKISIL